MPLWLPEAAARIHPLAVDKMLVAAGLAGSLTKARRAIADGSIYLNNEKLTPPAPGFLPVAYAAGYPHLYGWIWEALREGGWITPPEDIPPGEQPVPEPGDLHYGRYALLRRGKRAVAVIECGEEGTGDGEVGTDPGTGVHPGSAGIERAVADTQQESPREAAPALLRGSDCPRADARPEDGRITGHRNGT